MTKDIVEGIGQDRIALLEIVLHLVGQNYRTGIDEQLNGPRPQCLIGVYFGLVRAFFWWRLAQDLDCYVDVACVKLLFSDSRVTCRAYTARPMLTMSAVIGMTITFASSSCLLVSFSFMSL